MNRASFENLCTEDQYLLDAYANGTISAEDFETFQDRLKQSPDLRSVTRRYMGIVHTLEVESSGEAQEVITSWTPRVVTANEPPRHPIRYTAAAALAAAACLLLAWTFILKSSQSALREQSAAANGGDGERNSTEEPSTTGYGVIGRLADAEWANSETQYRSKDLLGEGQIHLLSGTAELQFFSGAVVTLQGPTLLDVKSAWEAVCREGRVRVQVPPAARGFAMHGPHTEIVDLGTEFGLVVQNDIAEVEVFTGQISIKHLDEPVRFVTAGDAWRLPPSSPSIASSPGSTKIPQAFAARSQDDEEVEADFQRWKNYRDAVSRDPRVIAYYTFDQFDGNGTVKDIHENGQNHDGTVILAESTDGRWEGKNRAMNFRRPGSRVRVNIPGEYPAFTFMCWVRIDSLDRWYNALFMGDGFETGEPHWQIQDNGELMLSIQVDHERPNSASPVGRGFHRNYHSTPFWNHTLSGKWLHLCSVFDPKARQVSHYLDGKRISREEIKEDYLIRNLRIGNAEIGNWGQPIQRPPEFAIRNLNGHMDEIAIYREALDDSEIAILFKRSQADHQ